MKKIWESPETHEIAIYEDEDGNIHMWVGDYLDEIILDDDERHDLDAWKIVADAIAQLVEYTSDSEKYLDFDHFPKTTQAEYVGYVRYSDTGVSGCIYIYDCGHNTTLWVEMTDRGEVLYGVEDETATDYIQYLTRNLCEDGYEVEVVENKGD